MLFFNPIKDVGAIMPPLPKEKNCHHEIFLTMR